MNDSTNDGREDERVRHVTKVYGYSNNFGDAKYGLILGRNVVNIVILDTFHYSR